jgi:hypothetical protein
MWGTASDRSFVAFAVVTVAGVAAGGASTGSSDLFVRKLTGLGQLLYTPAATVTWGSTGAEYYRWVMRSRVGVQGLHPQPSKP